MAVEIDSGETVVVAFAALTVLASLLSDRPFLLLLCVLSSKRLRVQQCLLSVFVLLFSVDAC